MTETLTEREAFERRIVAEPECDTARLVFADWLDEQPTKEHPCQAYGCDKGQIYRMRECKDGIWRNAWGDCEVCKGAGVVVDTSDRDRAEFIRVQIAASTRSAADAKHRELFRRGEALTAANPEWKRHKCPECKGTGVTGEGQDAVRCVACDGIGDLLLRLDGGRPSREVSRNPKFRRGFIDSVECTLTEAFVFPDAHSSTQFEPFPSPWAMAVAKALPVTRFVITDREPDEIGDAWCWVNDRPGLTGSAIVPRSMFDEMNGTKENGGAEWTARFGVDDEWVIYPTREAAIDALALAAGRIVRKAVYG